MEFEDLEDFVARRMRMSHVYQPLLIRLLVEAGGTATVRQLARGFAAADEAQVRAAALSLEGVRRYVEGRQVERVIYVPGRVVNIVTRVM